VTSDTTSQIDEFVTPGTRLRNARLKTELSEREVEDLLNLMPGYVGILERDDYTALRSPAFARGYVRAYGQLMKLDEAELLAAFDQQREHWAKKKKPVQTRPLQLQRTGVGVVVGLLILVLLVFALWWRQGTGDAVSSTVGSSDKPVPAKAGRQVNYED